MCPGLATKDYNKEKMVKTAETWGKNVTYFILIGSLKTCVPKYYGHNERGKSAFPLSLLQTGGETSRFGI
jgi:hypothetical protein